jgi:hypothetical protein
LIARADLGSRAEHHKLQAVNAAHAAKSLGEKVVNGLTGSSIGHILYSFRPVSRQMIYDGYELFRCMWDSILDEFQKCDVRFADTHNYNFRNNKKKLNLLITNQRFLILVIISLRKCLANYPK